MLFLHPEQKKLIKLELNGAARLRGVSGSGKTCVMVHRARYLAKKYGEKVLVVTLTESMRKLLDNLLNALCGAERGLILTYTMNSLAKDIIRRFHPRGEAWYTMATEQRLYSMEKEAVRIVSEHADFQKTLLAKLEGQKLTRFVIDEINYVRSRLPVKEYETYPTKSFKRTGRSQSLGEVGRRVCLEAIRYWDQELDKSHTLDYQGIVQAAWDLVTLPDKQNKASGFAPRCILVDEVQDLNQLEVRLLGQLRTNGEPIGTVENGLFLVGDGAQTIYKRGFSLSSIGVSVSGRSWVLKKNYRNSLEVLKAAYSLIDDYEFADIDEDSIQKPLEPDYATRHGDRPFIVKCRSLAEEAAFVTSQIQALVGEEIPLGQICVVGPNRTVREEVSRSLKQAALQWTELREDADFDNNRIKISTIESSKGHEFRAVFIAGLVDGVLPFHNAPSEDLPREAARLYVAMTRARDNLYLSYTSNAGFRPSPLLASVQKHCTEVRWHDHRLQPITDLMAEV
jgi:superfamily I DNA/RNA helicase